MANIKRNDKIVSKTASYDLSFQKDVYLEVRLDTKFVNSKHSTFYFATEQIVNLLLLRFDKLGLLAQALLNRSQPRILTY